MNSPVFWAKQSVETSLSRNQPKITMKKIIIAGLLTLSICTTYGQHRAFTFGLKAGANLSQLGGESVRVGQTSVVNLIESSDRQLGLVGGGFLRIGKKVFVQPEILLSQKGGKFTIGGTGGSVSTQKVDVKFTNVDFPLLVGGFIGNVLRVNVGPIATFNLSNNGNLEDSFNQYQLQGKDAFKQANIGYVLGIGADIGKLVFDLRYEGNFTDAIKADFGSSSTQFERKATVLQATIGFKVL